MAAFREKLAQVLENIEKAAQRSGRKGADIRLVAVTKGVTPERVLEAREAGLAVFGENRVQEALTKIPQVPSGGAEWHMVGHLQSNKVKDAVSLFSMIQSVDSVRLAQKISEEAALQGKAMPVLLEVNISGESQKYGFRPEEIYAALDAAAELGGIRVMGLMGIGPGEADPEKIREAFRKLKGLFSVCRGMKRPNVEMKVLSMGMSGDFEIAVEEGANMVRLGRALFS